jgi:hypothetical protein
MAARSITFGADPEVFLADARGRAMPACGLIGGTKSRPLMVDGFGLQEDNVMGEFTVPPSDSVTAMQRLCNSGMNSLLSQVQQRVPGAGIFGNVCAVEFSDSQLAAAGPQALQFGCSADFDAYSMGAPHQTVRPDALKTAGGAWRFAGGHIHIGYNKAVDLPPYVAAMFCDLTIGLQLVYYGEKQGERRRLYGLAGRFRPTNYGVEYRTPSCLWLFSRDLSVAVTEGARNLQRLLLSPVDDIHALYNEVPWNDVRGAIRDESAAGAGDILSAYTHRFGGVE